MYTVLKVQLNLQSHAAMYTYIEIERYLRVLESLGENINNNHLRVTIEEKFHEELICVFKIKLQNEDEKMAYWYYRIGTHLLLNQNSPKT